MSSSMLYVLIISLLWAYGRRNQLQSRRLNKGALSVSGSASVLARLRGCRASLIYAGRGQQSHFTPSTSNLRRCSGNWESFSVLTSQSGGAETVSQPSTLPSVTSWLLPKLTCEAPRRNLSAAAASAAAAARKSFAFFGRFYSEVTDILLRINHSLN